MLWRKQSPHVAQQFSIRIQVTAIHLDPLGTEHQDQERPAQD